MVTNRKSDANRNTITNPGRAVGRMPTDIFARVLHRHAGEDREQLVAERLAAWDELGRSFAAGGWHQLETAIAAACEAVNDPRLSASIAEAEAEQLVERFASDARRVLDAGGAEALWHIIVADRETPHLDVSGLADEHLGTAHLRNAIDGDAAAIDVFVNAARCYALAVIARGEGAEELRRLFGPGAEDMPPERIEDFAPFAVDNDPDGHATRVLDAAMLFAIAESKSNILRLEAVHQYAYGLEMSAARYSLRPFQRLGLIAWVARRGLAGEVDDAQEHDRWMQAGAALRERSPARFAAVCAELERYAAIEKPTTADEAEHLALLRDIAAGSQIATGAA